MIQTLQWTIVVPDRSPFHVSRVESTAPWHNAEHDHADFSEIFFVEYGELDHRINRRWTRLKAGALVWIQSSDRHGFTSIPDRPFAMVNVAFPNTVLRGLRRHYPTEASVCVPTPAAPGCNANIVPGRQSSVTQLFSAIRSAPRTNLNLDWFLLSAMREIMLHRATPKQAMTLPDWLERAVMLLNRPEHYLKNTRHFAALAGHSPEHVAREVHRHLNTTPTELLNRARLDQAATRLATTQEKIINIALDTGFNQLGHFYRQFQKRHHLTPRAYRLHHTATLPMLRSNRTED